MSGRGRRNNGRGGGRSGRWKNTTRKKSKDGGNKPAATVRSKLSDYIFTIGSSKAASDFPVILQYLINHLRITLTRGEDVATALEDRMEFDFSKNRPKLDTSNETDPDKKAHEEKELQSIFNAEISDFVKRKAQYKANLSNAYGIIYAQCSKALQQKLQERTDWAVIKTDPIKLIEAIEEHSIVYRENKYDAAIVIDSFRSLFRTRQKEDEDLVDYTRRFKSAKDVLESFYGSNLLLPKMIATDPRFDATSSSSFDECGKTASSRFYALLILQNADQNKYGTVLKGLESQYSLGVDQYPKTMVAAIQVLSDHTFDPAYAEAKRKRKDKEKAAQEKHKKDDEELPSASPDMTFAQLEGSCYCCGKKGHKSPQCKQKDKIPKEKWAINKTTQTAFNQHSERAEQSANSSLTVSTAQPPAPAVQQAMTADIDWMAINIGLAQLHHDMKNSILLDTGSTVNVFCNEKFVKDIKDAPKHLEVHTNAGSFIAKQIAKLPWHDIDVWFNPNSITNVLSFAVMANKFRITYDNQVGDVFTIHTPKGIIRFHQVSKNLYLYIPKVKNIEQHEMLQTLNERKEFYTPRQIQRATRARDLSRAIGCPSDADLRAILKMNSIKDCPVVEDDIKLAESIFGKDIAVLKGKITRQKPTPVIRDTVEIPIELKIKQYNVTLAIDTFFINKMPFFHTISENIVYRTTQWIPTRKIETYQECLETVFKLYRKAGFKITMICADMEFEQLLARMHEEFDFLPNIASAQEHVPIVERSIRTLKERCRATLHGNPYNLLPRVLIKSVVQECTRQLNFFPAKGGCSAYYSPREIMHEIKLDYTTQCMIPQLSYVLAHDEPNPTNTTDPRALDCIYMRPISNAQGGHQVLHLATNEVIVRRKVTQIPITPAIIKAVEALARRDNVTPFKMETKHGVLLYDASTAGVDPQQDENNNDDQQSDDEDEDYEDSENSDTDSSQDDDTGNRDEMDPDDIYDEGRQIPVVDHNVNANDEADNEEEQSQQATENNEEEITDNVQPTVRRSTRIPVPRERLNIASKKGKSYFEMAFSQAGKHDSKVTMTEYTIGQAHVIATIICRFNEDMVSTTAITHGQQHVITYSLKKALDKFGSKAKESANQEIRQMLDRKCFKPIHKTNLNEIERKRAMESLLFLSEKKDGTIKSRFCANGSTQRDYMTREETSSPTVSTEAILITGAIEALEGREVACCDIPNAFVQTEVQKTDKDGNRTIMKIRGVLVSLLCELDEEYKEFVVFENKQPVLYVEVSMAIYGMLVSALLFYEKLKTDLKGYGFETNPYDPCVANKIVNGKQLTVTWHVDDLKVSHQDKPIVDQFIQWIKTTYGKIGEVKVSRGKVHDYLGMKLDYSIPGQLSINMTEYVEKMVAGFPLEELNNSKPKTPWTDDLFTVDKESPNLARQRAEQFHTVVAQGLFLCKRGRPDISPAIAFLTTRVRASTVQDWNKLVRLILFLRATSKDVLTLRCDGERTAKWFVDAAFAVHPDMRSHTGAVFTLGKGAISTYSRKQNMNTRSSTEAELVAADDAIGPMIWAKNFLEKQGYPLKENILFQDNKSAILLETNGRASCGKRSRHLNIRLFFITDQKAKGNIDIQYCPTDQMSGDYMTKPLMGHKFVRFRQEVMNLPMAAQLFMAAFIK